MNTNLTKWQKNFLTRLRDDARKHRYSVNFWVDGSLTNKRQTIRFECTGERSQYLLTIDDLISSRSKLEQVERFFETGEDIGCKTWEERRRTDDYYELPF